MEGHPRGHLSSWFIYHRGIQKGTFVSEVGEQACPCVNGVNNVFLNQFRSWDWGLGVSGVFDKTVLALSSCF